MSVTEYFVFFCLNLLWLKCFHFIIFLWNFNVKFYFFNKQNSNFFIFFTQVKIHHQYLYISIIQLTGLWIHIVSKNRFWLLHLNSREKNFYYCYIWMESYIGIEFWGHSIFSSNLFRICCICSTVFTVHTVSCLPSIYCSLFPSQP